MAYVEVDNANRWTAEDDLVECSQVVQMVSTDTPYVAVDFSMVLNSVDDLVISSVGSITEKDAKAITIADADKSDDGKRVSFKISAVGGGPGDYVLNVPVTLSKGTGNVVTRRCVLRVL